MTPKCEPTESAEDGSLHWLLNPKTGNPTVGKWRVSKIGSFDTWYGYSLLTGPVHAVSILSLNREGWKYMAPASPDAATSEISRLREVLEWYADRAAGCRKITSEGDIARQELDADGGKKARAALTVSLGDR